MANTTNLNLPLIDGTMTADVPRDINALANAVDEKAGAANGLATLGADGKVPAGQLNVQPPADASLTQKGIVKLNSATNSTDETTAATPKAVKTAYDLASAAETPAGAQTKADTALNSAKSYVDAKPWQKAKLTNDDGTTMYLSNVDVNTLVTAGRYLVDTPINGPSVPSGGGNIWYVNVNPSLNPLFVTQEFVNYYVNSYIQRKKNNGIWSAWSADLFQSVVDGKNSVENAIEAKGGTVSDVNNPPTFQDLIDGVNSIPMGKAFATGTTTTDASGNLTISGLSFTPRLLVYNNGNNTYRGFYSNMPTELGVAGGMQGGGSVNYNAGSFTSGGGTFQGLPASTTLKWIAIA
ncbi:tail fiber protein [Paenibacillus sediminis]|uniref:Tail fiber protein n=1 Tax=Paenibacillus sediminis TaxID=664909 RepID=A0ABS4H6P4_9BACL|nr:tail fiber protein [Paenibacillus sediminis]MBP1938206.1 hypothetical protein [Paenibacillus sediminis]